jgi:preprotein translocase subunit SecE
MVLIMVVITAIFLLSVDTALNYAVNALLQLGR